MHLDLDGTFPKAQNHATILLMEEYKAIFDYTFDYTFTSITDNLVLNIEISNADCGIFIRWIRPAMAFTNIGSLIPVTFI